MILYNLFWFLFIIKFIHGLHKTHGIADSLENYPGDIRGFDRLRNNYYGFVIDNVVLLRKITAFGNKPLIEPIGKIELEGHSGEIFEFKFINENVVLICTDTGCSVCEKSESTSRCKYLAFDVDGTNFSHISASTNEDKLHIRAVKHNGNSSVYVFEPRNDLHYELVQQVTDISLMNHITVVGSFSTDGYTYFVGSASRKDLSTLDMVSRINTEIRLTRVCNGDKTRDLDSRIDIVLSCESIDYSKIGSGVNNTATSISYDYKTRKLYVAMYVASNKENLICSYNFDELQAEFAKTWEICQNIVDNEDTRRSCRKALTYKDLHDECFIFTWSLNTKLPFCSSFNGLKNELENCNLHLSNSTNKRYGWLENFKPINGTRVYSVNGERHFVGIYSTNQPNAMFALTNQNKLERLLIGNTQDELIYFPALSGKKTVYYDSDNDVILFVDPRLMTTINYTRITCANLYSNIDCGSLKWTDPLKCIYCTELDGNGAVTDSDPNSCNTGVVLKETCPPILTGGDTTKSGMLHITGSNLDRVLYGSRRVTYCGAECKIVKDEPNFIECGLSKIPDNCNEFTYSGKLKNYENEILFKKAINDEGVSSTTSSSGSRKEMKTLRNIAFGVAFLVLIVLIAICYYCISKKFPSRLQSKQSGGALSENDSEIEQHYNPVSDIPLDTISSRRRVIPGLINESQIEFLREIGTGYSAKVQLAKYYCNPKNISEYREVAVKIIDRSKCGMDPKKEMDLMKTCQHPNIVAFISSMERGNEIWILSEYMSGGSVLSYLQNQESRPTVGQCFDYIEQILSGMVYLSRQHIVHRDLATRNCLLNATHEILKISDFGLSRRTNNDYEYLSFGSNALPYKWLPLEVLNNCNRFHIKSDVWSFGVVVWELFTRGTTPYINMNQFEVKEYLEKGYRLPKPDVCPDELYDVMMCCWDADADKRPTFDDLNDIIKKYFDETRRENPEQMDYEYEKPISSTNLKNGAISNGSTSVTAV